MADTYSDIDINLSIDAKTSDFKKNVDIDAIRNSLRNILTTRKMERRMMPEFGASIEQLLFEPIDTETAKKIGSLMIQEVEYWDSRITVKNVNVIADEDNNRYDITLEYSIISSSINSDSIGFVLSA